MKWLWAAYRLGVFPMLPEGLTRATFAPTLHAAIETTRPGTTMTSLMANIPAQGRVPVGWLLGRPRSLNLPRVVEMHAIWAPWSSPRNRLEVVVSFLAKVRAQMIVVWSVSRSDARLFEHACRYGIARTVGTMRGGLGQGEDALIFQSVDLTH